MKKAKKRSRGRWHFATVLRLDELDALIAELETRHRRAGVETVLVGVDGEPLSPDWLTKAIGRVRDALDIVHIDPETGARRKKHLHDARGTFATKLMTTTDLTDREVAEMMGWSPHQVSHIRQTYVDQTTRIVALAERIRRSR